MIVNLFWYAFTCKLLYSAFFNFVGHRFPLRLRKLSSRNENLEILRCGTQSPAEIQIVIKIVCRRGKNLKLAGLHISHYFNIHPIWLQRGRGSPAKFKYAKREFESLERTQDTICGIQIGENQNFAGRAESELALANYKLAKYKK